MGASIEIQRRLDWPDTDAALRWHHSTVWRWYEAAETELHRGLGTLGLLYPLGPRRHVEATYHRSITFDEVATIRYEITEVGRTSMASELSIRVGAELAAEASMVVVHVGTHGRPTPWPTEAVRAFAVVRGRAG